MERIGLPVEILDQRACLVILVTWEALHRVFAEKSEKFSVRDITLSVDVRQAELRGMLHIGEDGLSYNFTTRLLVLGNHENGREVKGSFECGATKFLVQAGLPALSSNIRVWSTRFDYGKDQELF